MPGNAHVHVLLFYFLRRSWSIVYYRHTQWYVVKNAIGPTSCEFSSRLFGSKRDIYTSKAEIVIDNDKKIT